MIATPENKESYKKAGKSSNKSAKKTGKMVSSLRCRERMLPSEMSPLAATYSFPATSFLSQITGLSGKLSATLEEEMICLSRIKNDHVAMMAHTLGFPDEDGNWVSSFRCVYYPILGKGKKTEKVDEQNAFQTLELVKAQMTNSNYTKLAIPDRVEFLAPSS